MSQAIQFNGTNSTHIEEWSQGRITACPLLDGRGKPIGSFLYIGKPPGGKAVYAGEWVVRTDTGFDSRPPQESGERKGK